MGYRELAKTLYALQCKKIIGNSFVVSFTGAGSLIQKLDSSGLESIDAIIHDWIALQSESTCLKKFIRSGKSYDVVLDKESLRRFVTRTFTIFYSWQSWLPAETNKNLIREALNAAATLVNEREAIGFEIDSDLVGVAGATSFSSEIMKKIAKADVFVADVSAVGYECGSAQKPNRPIPNANVMFEYGYASAHIRAEQMILVHNTAYARVEELPSDIRHNKVICYTCSKPEDIARATQLLQDELVKELSIIAQNVLTM